jgi:hypothetical protein
VFRDELEPAGTRPSEDELLGSLGSLGPTVTDEEEGGSDAEEGECDSPLLELLGVEDSSEEEDWVESPGSSGLTVTLAVQARTKRRAIKAAIATSGRELRCFISTPN